MSSEDQVQGSVAVDVADAPKPTIESRKRPRLDLSAAGDSTRERKRGKSMFGIVLGTLNKAKIEDKERNASEAAKKRHLIEQRLQTKLRKETDSVRRAEEAKKNKNVANRREEDLQLRDSICKLRWTRHPNLANFLLTSDKILEDDFPLPSTNPLSLPPRLHPPPLYYLPAKLTPAQEAFLTRRKQEVKEATEKEWDLFKEERKAGIEEINRLRQHVVEEEAKVKSERAEAEMETDVPPSAAEEKPTSPSETVARDKDVNMEVDDTPAKKDEESNSNSSAKKEESVPIQADDDDAVEY